YSWRSIHPQATLHYITSLDQANALLQLLQGPVGFDLEWRPSFRKGEPEHPVSLVQLANSEIILLIQISAMQEFPTKLQEFLENPDFVKAGVAIQGDVKKLYRDWQVSVCNCVDLSLLARSVDNARWKGKYSASLGLARLVDVYEGLLLPKGKISRTNWEAKLNAEQQEYAGNDAHSGYIIYEKLIAMSNLMPIPPKPVYYTFDAVRGRLCEPSGIHWFAFNPDYDPGPPPPPK
ncbi:ribonuclease H-like domain-containing protein, partial [Collybia nuda]